MKEVHAISFTALIYSIILALVSLIFFKDYVTWTVLGSATALFNHSLMIRVTKGKYSAQKYVFHLFQRYVFYVLIMAVVWLRTKDLGDNVMMYSFIFLLLGIFCLKVAIYVNLLPFVKKWYKIKGDEHDSVNS
jgi:hypothetical protein